MPLAVKRSKKVSNRVLKVKSDDLKAKRGSKLAPKESAGGSVKKNKAASSSNQEEAKVKRKVKPASSAPEPWVAEYIQRLNSVVKAEGGKGSDMVLNSLEEDYEQATNPRTSFTMAEVDRFR